MLKNYSNTFSELLYSQNGAGNALLGNASAGTATLLSKQSSTSPLPVLDAGYFPPLYGIERTVRLVARGVISTVSANSQTLIVGAAYATSDTTTIGTTIAASGAFTPAASLSSAIFELELDFSPTQVGSAGTLQAFGTLTVNPTAAAGVTIGVGGSATVSFNTEAAAYLQIYATWGASGSSASNTLTCYQKFVWGLN